MAAKQTVVIKTTRTKARAKKGNGSGNKGQKRCSKCGRFM